MRDIDQISGDVLDAAIRLHKDLGPGLLESVYETLLAAQLSRMGYEVVQQYPVPLDYDGFHFPAAYKIDILVDRRLLLEIKSVDQLHASHAKQLLTYLRIFTARRAPDQFRRRHLEGGFPAAIERLRSNACGPHSHHQMRCLEQICAQECEGAVRKERRRNRRLIPTSGICRSFASGTASPRLCVPLRLCANQIWSSKCLT